MDSSPNAVAAQFDDVKAPAAHFALDRTTDVFRAVSRPRHAQRLSECRAQRNTRLPALPFPGATPRC